MHADEVVVPDREPPPSLGDIFVQQVVRLPRRRPLRREGVDEYAASTHSKERRTSSIVEVKWQTNSRSASSPLAAVSPPPPSASTKPRDSSMPTAPAATNAATRAPPSAASPSSRPPAHAASGSTHPGKPTPLSPPCECRAAATGNASPAPS